MKPVIIPPLEISMQPSKSTIRKRIQYWWEMDKAINIPLLYIKRDFTQKHESLDYRTIYKRIYRWREYNRAISTPKNKHWWARFKYYTNND